MRSNTVAAVGVSWLGLTGTANAALLTDPDDRQGGTVGTPASLFFGSNTFGAPAMVADAELRDDGLVS